MKRTFVYAAILVALVACLRPDLESRFTPAWEPFDPVEDAREDPVKGVEERLALDQGRAGEVVEAHQVGAVQTLREGLHQHHPLLHPDRDALVAKLVEEIEKHAAS